MLDRMQGWVVAVCLSPTHGFSKTPVREATLRAGHGMVGDAHAGATVKHRYRVRKDPTAPNLCQVHLLQEELFAKLAGMGIAVSPGEMGENVTTSGIDLLALPVGARVHLGDDAVVEITGLREPCVQMNGLRPGLMKACRERDAAGGVVRKSGVMGVVLVGGVVRTGDTVRVTLPEQPWRKMGPV
jgi:MOSC domain-containing protein YiiM